MTRPPRRPLMEERNLPSPSLGGPGVVNSRTDIAERFDGMRMRVQLPGRKKLSLFYLWKTPNGCLRSKRKYDSAETQGVALPAQPSPTESVSDEDGMTGLFLEVGIIDGDDPIRAKPAHIKTHAAKNSMAIIPRPMITLRVFAPIENRSRVDLSVGVMPVHGRLQIRSIDPERVFYHRELWNLLPDNVKVQYADRKFSMKDLIRYLVSAETETVTDSSSFVSFGDNVLGQDRYVSPEREPPVAGEREDRMDEVDSEEQLSYEVQMAPCPRCSNLDAALGEEIKQKTLCELANDGRMAESVDDVELVVDQTDLPVRNLKDLKSAWIREKTEERLRDLLRLGELGRHIG